MAIYSWFTHKKWWFSIVFCMFTRGYSAWAMTFPASFCTNVFPALIMEASCSLALPIPRPHWKDVKGFKYWPTGYLNTLLQGNLRDVDIPLMILNEYLQVSWLAVYYKISGFPAFSSHQILREIWGNRRKFTGGDDISNDWEETNLVVQLSMFKTSVYPCSLMANGGLAYHL